MLAPVALVPRPGTSLAELDQWFTTAAGCASLPVTRLTRTYFDTVDGRLFRAGLVLEHELLEGRRWWRVRRLDQPSALVLAQAPAGPLGPGPRLAPEALADGRLRALLEPASGGRALLAVLHTEATPRRYRLPDELDKAVVRVSVTAGSVRRVDGVRSPGAGAGAGADHDVRPSGGRARADLLDPVITLSPVRGHDKAFGRLVDLVRVQFSARSATDPLRRAARRASMTLGTDPGDRTAPLRPDLAKRVARSAQQGAR
ncbi:MAG: hypothetical protein ACKV2O_18395 [Acidimicrobiales bacterium]